jgi:hypothetical protein
MPATSIIRRSRTPIRRANLLLDATVRDFSGGWNVVDNDLNLDTRFAKKISNMQRGLDGSLSIRPGTRLFADCKDYLDDIVNQWYYNGAIVVVGLNGKIVKVDANGKVDLLFDDDVAKSLPGAPSGWSTTEFCTFAVSNSNLTIHNGVNKPLLIPLSFTPTFLNDPATGSNANTPIGRYAITHGRFLIIAGIDGTPDRLAISSSDTSGVFVGDPAPNDAVNINLGSRVPEGDDAIIGLGRFRDKLVVTFEDVIIVGSVGAFTGTVHVPVFDDAIENHGSISHRTIQRIGEDMIFADTVGVNSVRRALFTGEVQPGRLSDLIDPEIQFDLGLISKTKTFRDKVFSAYDSYSKNYMLFVPNSDNNITETRCFVFKKNAKLKIESWQEYRGWNFSSATRSVLKRMFFSRGTEIFILGDELNDRIYKDFVGSEEMWTDELPFTDGRGFSPVADDEDSGVTISFLWELPWSDAKNRFNVKTSKYLGFDTTGEQEFTVEMFIDNIYADRSNLGETFLEDDLPFDDGYGFIGGVSSSLNPGQLDVLDPALSLQFIGGDSIGFGLDKFGSLFGGGRPTSDQKLYEWPATYKIQKMRLSGDGRKELQIVSMTLAYLLGGIRR